MPRVSTRFVLFVSLLFQTKHFLTPTCGPFSVSVMHGAAAIARRAESAARRAGHIFSAISFLWLSVFA